MKDKKEKEKEKIKPPGLQTPLAMKVYGEKSRFGPSAYLVALLKIVELDISDSDKNLLREQLWASIEGGKRFIRVGRIFSGGWKYAKC